MLKYLHKQVNKLSKILKANKKLNYNGNKFHLKTIQNIDSRRLF